MGGRREQPGNKWAGVTKEEGPATRPKFSDGHNLTGFGRMRIAPRRCRGNHCTGWTMAANSASILWPIDCRHYVGDSGIFAAHYRAGAITMSFGRDPLGRNGPETPPETHEPRRRVGIDQHGDPPHTLARHFGPPDASGAAADLRLPPMVRERFHSSGTCASFLARHLPSFIVPTCSLTLHPL